MEIHPTQINLINNSSSADTTDATPKKPSKPKVIWKFFSKGIKLFYKTVGDSNYACNTNNIMRNLIHRRR